MNCPHCTSHGVLSTLFALTWRKLCYSCPKCLLSFSLNYLEQLEDEQ